jgi:methionine synthase II (cobalamin-independent)
MLQLKGLATGIGSLPYAGTSAPDKALELVFECVPQIPFWPQLPKRDILEGMTVQFSEKLPCLSLSDGDLVFHPENKDSELEIFYEKIINQDIDYFQISRNYALGLYEFHNRLKKDSGALRKIEFIKCHITGPFTFAAGLKDEKEIALLHDPIFMQAIIKGLAMKGLWQIKFFKEFKKKIIVFIDEPYLAGFGSAFTPLSREEVLAGLGEVSEKIKSEGQKLNSLDVLTGVHCCGNTDWSIFADIQSIDIINFDAFGFLEKFIIYAPNIKDFLKRGGIICWGIVPTHEFSGKETADLLALKVEDGIKTLVNKGVDKNLICRNLLLSPACGLGMLTPDKSEEILRLLSETSALLRKNL